MEPHPLRAMQGAHPAHRSSAQRSLDRQPALSRLGREPGSRSTGRPLGVHPPAFRTHLEDVWVKIALQSEQEARQIIDRTATTQNPFDAKYSVVEDSDWETCAVVVDPLVVMEQLSRGW